MKSMQCNEEFGYQHRICSSIEENYGKPKHVDPKTEARISNV
jgi:hypothetical protein